MTWVRLDEGFAQHPKVAAAGPLAIAMQVAGLCYCNKNLTDGFIPWSVAQSLLAWKFLGPDDGKGRPLYKIGISCGMVGDDADCARVIEILLDAKMWHEIDGGYVIHDYLDYNPSKAEVLAARESKKEAGRLGGRRSADSKHSHKHSTEHAPSTAKADGQAKSNPGPVPVPVPGSDPVPGPVPVPEPVGKGGKEGDGAGPPPAAPPGQPPTTPGSKERGGRLRVIEVNEQAGGSNGLSNPEKIRRWFYVQWAKNIGNGSPYPQEPEKDDAQARRILNYHRQNKIAAPWPEFVQSVVEAYMGLDDPMLTRDRHPMRLLSMKLPAVLASIGGGSSGRPY